MIQKLLGGGNGQPPRTVQLLATFALFLIVGVAGGAVAYDSVVNDDDQSTVLLGTLATSGLAALIVLSGGKDGRGPGDSQ